jgi:hypothetical protein
MMARDVAEAMLAATGVTDVALGLAGFASMPMIAGLGTSSFSSSSRFAVSTQRRLESSDPANPTPGSQ